jgi:hypothetical protein
MKRFVAAAFIAGGMCVGVAAPAGAIIIIGGADATLGGPDTRIGVEVGMEPCIADGLMQPCIAEVTAGIRIDSSGRS